jgi:hypothetical protein
MKKIRLGMVVHAYNLSTQEAEAGGSGVQSQPWLHNETMSQKQKQNKKEIGKIYQFIYYLISIPLIMRKSTMQPILKA